MKKLLQTNGLILHFAGLSLCAFALLFVPQKALAQLINPGFETWTPDLAVPSAMNPNSGNGVTGWDDFNFFNYAPVGGSPVSVFRCDTAHSGIYSARIETQIYTQTSWNMYKAWGIPFIGHNYSDTLGILFNGNQNETTVTYEPGIPFTQKIATFSFYYKYAPKAGDFAECRALLVKQRNSVGGGLVKMSSAASAWTLATISFLYVDTVSQPDTLYILFSASSLDATPIPGSVLWVDDVSVTLVSGINEEQVLNDVSIYPNPTSGKFALTLKTTIGCEHCSNNSALQGGGQIEIYNVLGEKVYEMDNVLGMMANGNNTSTINHQPLTIDLSSHQQGIYFIRIITEQGTATKKLIIQ